MPTIAIAQTIALCTRSLPCEVITVGSPAARKIPDIVKTIELKDIQFPRRLHCTVQAVTYAKGCGVAILRVCRRSPACGRLAPFPDHAAAACLENAGRDRSDRSSDRLQSASGRRRNAVDEAPLETLAWPSYANDRRSPVRQERSRSKTIWQFVRGA